MSAETYDLFYNWRQFYWKVRAGRDSSDYEYLLIVFVDEKRFLLTRSWADFIS